MGKDKKGNNDYRLTEDGLKIIPKNNKEYDSPLLEALFTKSYSVKSLLFKIKHGNFKNIQLFFDKYCIAVKENGRVVFHIMLTYDQQDAIKNGTATGGLKDLVEASTNFDDIIDFIRIQRESREGKGLPNNKKILEEYKEYLERCMANATKIQKNNCYSFYSPYESILLSYLLHLVSETHILASTNASTILDYSSRLFGLIGVCLFVDFLFLNKHILSLEEYKKWQNEAGWEIKECEDEIEKVNNEINRIESFSNYIKYLKGKFYEAVKELVSNVYELSEDERKGYLIRIRLIVKEFDKQIKEFGSYYAAEEFYNQKIKQFNEIDSDVFTYRFLRKA